MSDIEEKKETGGDESEKKLQLDSIIESGGLIAKNSKEAIHFLNIIGQIEGHYILGETQKTTKYEHIIPILAAVEENENIEGLLVLLNTMGGDVEAGLAIAEMIASMSKPSVSLVLGGGHSIGVPLAVAANYSFIVPSATMTIHPVRVNGLIIGVQQSFDYFKEMQKRIVRFITGHSGVNEEKLMELMMRPDELANDIGSIVEGEEAVSIGLINQIGGLKDAMAKLRELMGKK